MKYSLLFLIFCSSVFGQQNKDSIVKTDGIYQTKCMFDSDSTEGQKSFLRFYADTKVISVTSECDAEVSDLKDWFNLDMKYLSVGNFKINGKKIQFFTTSKEGTVNYLGHFEKEGILSLKSKSLINNYKDREKYEFVKIFQPK